MSTISNALMLVILILYNDIINFCCTFSILYTAIYLISYNNVYINSGLLHKIVQQSHHFVLRKKKLKQI